MSDVCTAVVSVLLVAFVVLVSLPTDPVCFDASEVDASNHIVAHAQGRWYIDNRFVPTAGCVVKP